MTEPKKTLAQRVLTMLTGIDPATRTRSGFRSKVTPEQEAEAAGVDAKERRQFRRIAAPVYCRAAGLKVFSKHEESIDVSRGGVRVYSDEILAIGDRLTMELFLKDQSATFDAEVAWIEALEPGAPGKYDVGLKFLHLSAENEALLARALE
jgi:c-di-GMP-binding flagellar brake protein YcgR